MAVIKIAYFSGTGGTKRIAECAASEIEAAGHAIDLERMYAGTVHEDTFEHYDLLLLVSVVHEFNLPQVVRMWVSSLDQTKYTKAAVFSVSGGGCAAGNRGAQQKVIERLEELGIPVSYDEIIALPSNFFYRIKHPVDAMLMDAYPVMVKRAVHNVLAGETQRPKTPAIDRFVTRCFKNSWKHTHKFGSAIKATNACTACGKCVRICPVDNIKLNSKTNKPEFSDACTFCLGCLYVCPESALLPGRDKYALLKDGYDLKEIEQRSYDHAEWGRVEALCKGYLYSGIKTYLLEARALLFPEEYSL